jgi:hypothetical protein
MPNIPLPPSVDRGTFGQQARTIPESSVRATPDAFGANVADANYRGAMRAMSLYQDAAASENRMWNTLIGGTTQLIGEHINNDLRLEAERKLSDLSLGITKETEEGEQPTGDGSRRTKTLETFDERAQALLDGARTPYQTQLYREGIQRLRLQHDQQLVSAEAAAARQARLDNINRINEVGEVDVFRDPSRLGEVRDRMVATINSSNLSPSQRSRLLQESERRLTSIALESMVNAGNIGGAQRMMADDRTITALGGLEAVRAASRIKSAAEAARKRQEAEEYQRQLSSGEARVDPANPEHRGAINSAFEQTGGPQLLAAGDANAVTTVANWASRYGMVPSSAISILQGMAANGTTEQQIFALQAVGTIETARPDAFASTPLHGRLRDEAERFRFLVTGINGLGLDPQTAIQMIQEQRKVDPAITQARQAQLDGTARRLDCRLSARKLSSSGCLMTPTGQPRQSGTRTGATSCCKPTGGRSTSPSCRPGTRRSRWMTRSAMCSVSTG